MPLWIKICGNTSLADALVAARAGADAVGFVFAPSPRRVTPGEVAAITPRLPAHLEKIGVFVDASLEGIAAAVRTAGLTGVQLHFDAAPELPAQLRAQFGPALRILRVVHFGAHADASLDALDADPNLDALLIDSRTATVSGGTGIAYDWRSAAQTLFQNAKARKCRRVAAGGLTPENVAEAVATLRPWGIDAVTGVEAAPGRKDSEKVRQFIANARSASA